MHLRQSLPDFHIFPQVAVSQLLTVITGAQRRAWFSKIDRLVVDFVVCDVSLKPVGVIECDGPSHRANKQQARDFKKDKAFEVAGLKVVRIAAGKLPDATELQGRFRSASAV